MKEPKDKKIEAKCTKTELAKVKQMASENKMSIAEFVRARVLFEGMPKYTLFETRAIKILSVSAALMQLQYEELSGEKLQRFLDLLKEFNNKNDVSSGINLDSNASTENHK